MVDLVNPTRCKKIRGKMVKPKHKKQIQSVVCHSIYSLYILFSHTHTHAHIHTHTHTHIYIYIYICINILE